MKFPMKDSFKKWASYVLLVLSILFAIFKLHDYLNVPNVIYATLEIDTYPVVLENKNQLSKEMPEYLRKTASTPTKIIGVAVKNIGTKAAENVLVQFPNNKPFVGWMVKASEKNQVIFDNLRGAFKFNKLLSGEEIDYYIYMTNTYESIVDDIKVTFDGGLALHYPYKPVPPLVAMVFSRALPIVLFQVVGTFLVVLIIISMLRNHDKK